MREARIRCAAEWKPKDMMATVLSALIETGLLSLDGLITHRLRPRGGLDAYRTRLRRFRELSQDDSRLEKVLMTVELKFRPRGCLHCNDHASSR
jgi:hypothetical protein